MARRTGALALLLFLTAVSGFSDWAPVAEGVDYQRIRRDTIDVHVARIDVKNRSLRLKATTEQERGLTVSEYAGRTGAIVAINGDYFDEKLQPLGKAVGACGLWGHGAPLKRNQGLVAVGKRRAEIQANTQKVRWWVRGAVSGWPLLVSDCKPVEKLPGSDHFTRAPHPRTAVGLSADRATMYFVVADGRQEGVPGMTLPELAQFMAAELGACTAMNLDGGGSSAMWIGDRIVNRPSDGPERKVGNHLAVIPAASDRGCERERREKR